MAKKESVSGQKKKRGTRTAEEQSKGKAGCRFHICLTLPCPETEMAVSGYDTYYVALRKLVHAYLSTMVRRTRDRRKRSSFCGMYYKMPCSLVIYSIVRGHRQLIGFSIKL